MKYEGLIKMENAALKVEEREFLLLHNEIMYYGNAAAVNIVEMARKLKEMKDGKKYLSADFQTFGEYVENAVGIKERQAYNYISILERLPENFLQSNAKIGITKLALLAPLPSQDREEIAEEVDLEKISVRELEEKIAERDKRIEQLTLDLSHACDLANDAQTKIEELKNEPKPVVEDPKTKKKLDEALKAKKEAEKKLSDESEKAKKEAADKQALIENLTKQRDEATAKAKELQAELNAAKEEKKPVFNNDLSFFKAKFEDFQRQGKDLINLLKNMDSTTPGDAVKCRNALLTLLTKIEEAAQ